jgi:hypothetical protein
VTGAPFANHNRMLVQLQANLGKAVRSLFRPIASVTAAKLTRDYSL